MQYLKKLSNLGLTISKCSTSGLDGLVNSLDTFWLPKIDSVHIFFENICKKLYFNKYGVKKYKISNIFNWIQLTFSLV